MNEGNDPGAASGALAILPVVPPPAPPAPVDWFARFLVPAAESRGWLKFLGGVLFALGVVTGLTIVGLVVAWLYIWVGVLLWQAAGKAEHAQLTRDPAEFEEYLKRLRTLIVIAGVVTAVHLAALILFLSLAAAFGWIAMLMHSIVS
jgi:hypothetical protein